jgi:hypothetical protein
MIKAFGMISMTYKYFPTAPYAQNAIRNFAVCGTI